MTSPINGTGIYRITIQRPAPAGPVRYIGQAAILRKRRDKHLSELRRGIHGNPRLQHSFDKYGEAAFGFEALLFCERLKVITDAAEQAALDAEFAAFPDDVANICRESVGSCLGIRLSEEHKAKIGNGNRGKKHTPEFGEAVRQRNLGRKQSDEEKAKRAVSMTGKKFPGRVLSEEHKRHVGDAARGKKRDPEVMARCVATRRQRAEERGFWIAPEIVSRVAEGNRGVKHSQEHKDKISASLRARAAALAASGRLVGKPWLAAGVSQTTWYRRKLERKSHG